VWLVMVLIPKLAAHETVKAQNGQPEASIRSELKPFLDLIRPKAGFMITPIVIYINTAIYALMAIIGLGFISFKGQDLLHWGANYGPLVRQGEWWRLMTNIFLHGGLMHLLANMYGLLFIGIFLEPVLGTKRFLSFYLLSGLLASLASIVWYPATVSVGASGAIFGLYGVFLALLLTKVFSPEFAKAFLLSTLIFIGFNLVAGLAGGIDNAAHIGGLISGFITGLVYRMMLPKGSIE
ncbi:MAG: rhomboid family intramembrane serine protease, partial [Sphingobacteriaceae bacterium]